MEMDMSPMALRLAAAVAGADRAAADAGAGADGAAGRGSKSASMSKQTLRGWSGGHEADAALDAALDGLDTDLDVLRRLDGRDGSASSASATRWRTLGSLRAQRRTSFSVTFLRLPWRAKESASVPTHTV